MLRSILDLLFPKQNIYLSKTDNYLTDSNISNFEPRLKKISSEQSKYINAVFVLSKYSNPIIHDLIHRAKYLGEYDICKSFS